MSSGQRTRKDPFNPIQIKDGWIVRLSKDGRIREKIEPWIPGGMKKNKTWVQ